jgi:predicted RNase H-like nuclease (RuvC/YqgF family)
LVNANRAIRDEIASIKAQNEILSAQVRELSQRCDELSDQRDILQGACTREVLARREASRLAERYQRFILKMAEEAKEMEE